MATFIQRSFAGGEIAPSVYGRVDLTKYATGLRTCRNFIVFRHGGVGNRPGTKFVAEVKDSTKAVRLIPFVFNSDQTYVLEFGDLYMRVHKEGGQIVESGKTITGATNADPVVVSVATHGYTTGEEVFITGVGGMTELNNRNFKVGGTTAGTFELVEMDGSTDLDGTSFGTYTSGGTSSLVFEIATPYAEADLPTLQFVQSADVITIVHPTYAPRDLSRLSDTSWTLSIIDFEPSIDRPADVLATKGGAGSKTFKYQVTAIKNETGEESLAGLETTVAITGATNADPVVITTGAPHGYTSGDTVFITGVGGMTEINDREFNITVTGASTFELDDEDGTGHGTYTSGGTSGRTFDEITSAADPTSTAPHVITWTAVADAREYNIYKELNGIFGFIGIAGGTSFDDTGIDADTTDTPPDLRNPFENSGDFPSAVAYFQQRRLFANTTNDPERVFGSRTANFSNFTTSSPSQSDDAVTFDVVGRQVNSIKHMIDLGGLVLFTQGGEWNAEGDDAGILRPGEINLRQVSYYGSGDLAPIIVGNTALFVQGRGSIIRDLGFDVAVDNYRGNDLTIFSAHLFDNFTLKDWTYQQIPHSIVWAVRDDGSLLGLTFVREHEVFGWHRHDFDGTVENVAAVPEGNEDSLYLIIKRTIDGRTVRYLEQMKTRQIDDIVDSVFMDSSLSLDGRNTDTGHTMTISGGPPWTYQDTLTLTSSTAFFASTDVGSEIHFPTTDDDGNSIVLRFSIDAFTSTTIVTGKPNRDVPTALQSTATSTWSKAVKSVTGLWHLEGKSISAFGDGFVIANPNNPAYTSVTVSSGTATFAKAFATIHVGLPYTSDLQTLDLDTSTGESMVDKNKNITEMHIFLEDSRGIFAGSTEPTSTTSVADLRELKVRNEEGYDDPVSLLTGTDNIIITSKWDNNGRVFIRQTDPIPLSVLAIAPSGYIPFSGG